MHCTDFLLTRQLRNSIYLVKENLYKLHKLSRDSIDIDSVQAYSEGIKLID